MVNIKRIKRGGGEETKQKANSQITVFLNVPSSGLVWES